MGRERAANGIGFHFPLRPAASEIFDCASERQKGTKAARLVLLLVLVLVFVLLLVLVLVGQ